VLEIPEYLICKITLDIMENPVVSEAGHCYEKEVLEEHLMKNGGIDPSTRKPISGRYYENYNIKQAI
jgi:STIP1 family protein 1